MPYADYQRHLEENRKRQRTPQGAANHARAVRAYRLRQRKRRAAHNAVAKALIAGKIVPWPVCVLPSCMETKLEAHHADYDDPLGVTWICGPHHKEVHRIGKQLLRGR